MSLLRRFKKAFVSPDEIIPFFVGKFQTRRRWIDGRLFHEYRGQLYPDHLRHGNAQSYIQAKALEYCKGRGIDVGASEWPLPGAEAVQERRRKNALILDDIPPASLDFVFSSHCLEHVANWQEALRLWVSKVKPGGIIFLYLPHEDMALWRPEGPWAGPSHKWKPTWQVLQEYFMTLGLEVIEINRARDAYWSFHVVGRRGDAGS